MKHKSSFVQTPEREPRDLSLNMSPKSGSREEIGEISPQKAEKQTEKSKPR